MKTIEVSPFSSFHRSLPFCIFLLPSVLSVSSAVKNSLEAHAKPTNQSGQDYNGIIFGDVATGYVHRPEGMH
jgi:hypothetical protein